MTSSPWPLGRPVASAGLDPSLAQVPLAPVPDRPASSAPAMRIGPYVLLAQIGEGGMGVVHLARHDDGRRVALKVLRTHIVGDAEARHRLAREVSSLQRVRSRWVAEVLDADPWAAVPYVATRYVPGLSLHDHVLEEGPVAGADLCWLASGLAEGIATVHAAGVLHRDVKPANVLMEGRTPILIDFGLARVADDPRLTHTGWLIGTPGYLAPEILYGEDATVASDVHSWAATVAWAATSRGPFGGGPAMAIMDRVRRGEHDLTGVPPRLRELLSAALDPNPVRRPTLDGVRVHLAALGSDPGPGPVEVGETLPYAQLARRDAERPTRVGPPETGSPTRVLTTYPPLRAVPPVPTPPVPAPPVPATSAPARATAGERLRRLVLLAVLGADVGLATASAPWVSLLVLLVGVWLLRSASLAGSAVADRRRLRGRRWYDGPLALVRAPWDLVRSLPGTGVLVLWSVALAVSAALLCYAAATSLDAALIVVGSTLALSLWTGPGGLRVRAPLRRVLRPTARDSRAWLVALITAVGVGLLLAVLISHHGPTWAPADGAPFSGLFSAP